MDLKLWIRIEGQMDTPDQLKVFLIQIVKGVETTLDLDS